MSSPSQSQSTNRLGVILLWITILLFIVCGTLLSTAAAIQQFAISSKVTTGGFGDSTTVTTLDIGAFRVVSNDGGFALEAAIDSNCDFNLEGFEENLVRESSSACGQFNAFRSLLIIAIVFDAIVAFIIYTCILLQWLPPSASNIPLWRHWALTFLAVIALAANCASFALMSQLIASEISIDVEPGVSWRMSLAAFVITCLATLLLWTNCQYCYNWPTNQTGQDTTSTNHSQEVKSLGDATHPALELTTITTTSTE